jgi:hypothetical protein
VVKSGHFIELLYLSFLLSFENLISSSFKCRQKSYFGIHQRFYNKLKKKKKLWLFLVGIAFSTFVLIKFLKYTCQSESNKIELNTSKAKKTHYQFYMFFKVLKWYIDPNILHGLLSKKFFLEIYKYLQDIENLPTIH